MLSDPVSCGSESVSSWPPLYWPVASYSPSTLPPAPGYGNCNWVGAQGAGWAGGSGGEKWGESVMVESGIMQS